MCETIGYNEHVVLIQLIPCLDIDISLYEREIREYEWNIILLLN